MEWKEDEQYHYTAAMEILRTGHWPWVGINSGVYIANPGLSIWVFAALAWLSGVTTPTGLAQAVQVLSILGLGWVAAVGYANLEKERSRELWLWALLLALVNPFLIWMHRKLWPQGFLPFWIGWMLLGYWNRRSRFGAALWGFFGATLGQVHMAGFFVAAALAAWEVLFRSASERRASRWGWWVAASTVGALPLIPWLIHLRTQYLAGPVTLGLREFTQLKFWNFWFTDPTGLHLGNTLGVTLGNSQWVQIREFLTYPYSTYLSALAHAALLGATLVLWIQALRSHAHLLKRKATWIGTLGNDDTLFLQNAQLLGSGLLMVLPTFMIRRYYMAATYPWEFIFLARIAFLGRSEQAARRWLTVLFVGQLLVSTFFVHYLWVNDGAPRGDYGVSYRAQMRTVGH